MTCLPAFGPTRPAARALATLWALICLVAIALPTLASAQACPEGNVLKGVKPKSSGATFTTRMVDGTASKEGDPWKTQLTAIISSEKSHVTFDLGETTTLTAALIQADNNDIYTLEISDDGQEWRTLWKAPAVPEAGVRTRSAKDLSGAGRYLRLKASGGDKFYSVGELQAFCSAPSPWPPTLTRKTGTMKDPGKTRLRNLAAWKAGVGAVCLLLLLLSLAVRRDGSEGVFGKLAPWLEGAVGLVAFGSIFLINDMPDPKADMIWPLGITLLIGAVMLIGALVFKFRLSPWLEIGATVAVCVALWMTYQDFKKDETGPWPLIVGAVLVVGLLGWWRAKGGSLSTATLRRLHRPILMGTITAVSVLCWTNFWTFHGWRAVHMHDTFHYHIGSKYFPENRYTRLYHCAAIAELEDGRKKQVDKRKIRNLENNILGPSKLVTDDPQRCRDAFTSNDRWELFKADLRYFRNNMGGKYWDKIFGDHGYNASPVWTMAGKLFADSVSVPIEPRLLALSKKMAADGRLPSKELREFNKLTKKRNDQMDVMVQRLALFDGLLYAGVFILIGWAFGWRIMAIAALCWGAGYPWAYFWTGGAYLRIPWLFTAVAGICFLKKQRPFWGGFFLMWSLLLRAFPGALIVGIAIKVLVDMIRGRDKEQIEAERAAPGPLSRVASVLGPLRFLIDRIKPKHQRVIAGTFAAIFVLVPMSLPSSGGIGSYKEFWENSQKHVKTPLTNHMGLPTVASYHPKKVGREIRKGNLTDPWKVWKAERIKTRKIWWRRGLYIATILGFLGLLYVIGRRFEEDWIVTAASAVLIIGLFELTSYYYVFMILFAPLVGRSPSRLVAYLLIPIISQILYLRIGWYDEQYTAETVLCLVGVLYMLFDLIGQGNDATKPTSLGAPEDDPEALAEQGEAGSTPKGAPSAKPEETQGAEDVVPA